MASGTEDKNPVKVEIDEINPVISTVLSLDKKKINVYAKDADDAMKYIDEIENIRLNPEFEKKLVRKIDWLILPVIIALMSCQLMDKTTNSYAAIMGLRTDLHMTAKEYSWVGSSFYFGYLFFQFPADLCLQRFPLSKTLSTAVIIWSIILMCHAACKTPATFILCRVLLGAFEGFMNPAYILITSQWYRKSENYLRVCIWWGFEGFGTILGAGIAYGLAKNRSGEYSFSSWRLLYIITGIITLVLGVISFLHMPDSPAKAWFLNDKEKKYCLERARDNQQGFGNHHFKKTQVIEAIKDPTLYLFFFYGMSYAIPNGGFNNFGSILLHGDFGFSTEDALLMNMPGGAIDIIFPMCIAFFNFYVMKGRRLLTCVFVNLFVVIGMCCLNFSTHRGSKLFGYLTFYVATASSAGVLSTMSSNVAGYSKKALANAMYLFGYCTGNILANFTFKESESPGYISAKTAMLVSFIAGTIFIGTLMIIYIRRNREKDRKREKLGDKYHVPDNVAFADLTDIQNPEFRYAL